MLMFSVSLSNYRLNYNDFKKNIQIASVSLAYLNNRKMKGRKDETEVSLGPGFIGQLALYWKSFYDYDLTKMDVTAIVNSDGSLSMIRRSSMTLTIQLTGLITQNLASGQSHGRRRVRTWPAKDGRPALNNQADSGNVYHFNKDGNSYKFKVYHHVDEGRSRWFAATRFLEQLTAMRTLLN